MTQLYGLQKCSTCKKAMAWLDQRGIEYQFTDYREQPIAPELVRSWATELGWPRVVNRASMTWRNLPDSSKNPQSDAEWLALVAEYPALIRRPVVVSGERVRTGFSEKAFRGLFAEHAE